MQKGGLVSKILHDNMDIYCQSADDFFNKSYILVRTGNEKTMHKGTYMKGIDYLEQYQEN